MPGRAARLVSIAIIATLASAPLLGGVVRAHAADATKAPVPDADLLLDLDLLRETRAMPTSDLDFLKALPLVERMKLLEALRLLESQNARDGAPRGGAQ